MWALTKTQTNSSRWAISPALNCSLQGLDQKAVLHSYSQSSIPWSCLLTCITCVMTVIFLFSQSGWSNRQLKKSHLMSFEGGRPVPFTSPWPPGSLTNMHWSLKSQYMPDRLSKVINKCKYNNIKWLMRYSLQNQILASAVGSRKQLSADGESVLM